MNWFLRGREHVTLDGASAALLEAMAELDFSPIATIRTRILDRLLEYAGAEHGVLLDRRASAGRYHATLSSTLLRDFDVREASGRWQPSEKLCRWLGANQQCLDVGNDHAVTSYLPIDDTGLFEHWSVRLIVPMVSGGRLPALVLLTSWNPSWQLSESVRGTLCAAGRVAGAAIERAHTNDAEQERLAALHQAQQLTVAGRLAAEVAHEVRNPLAAIRLTIQGILERQFDEETSTRMLSRTLVEVDRIQETVSRLLNLGRPEELTLEDVNLAEVAGKAVDVIRSLARRSGIKLEIDLRQPLLVRADPAEMNKVFLNLLMNGCQAMPGGGSLRVESRIVTSRPLERPPFGCISVADSGSAVDQRWLEKAFVPFFTTKKTGTGLGLPVSLDIVTRHGGRLELAIGNPSGTLATVALPLKDEQDTDA